MYTDSGPVSGMPEKCRKSQRSPRRIIRYAATGESMPPDMSTRAWPLIPTGRPPWPGWPSVYTNTSCWSTSTNTVLSGCFRLTGYPYARWTSAPILVASSAELSGNRLSRRRARTAKEPVFPAINATAVPMAASGSLATRTARQTLAIPMTSRARSAILSTAASAASAPSAARSMMTP